MRQKRAKAYRKLMHLYCMNFGFRQPYQVLVDSEMCRSALSQNLDFVKHLGTVLQGEVKPMITQCCIHELYLRGKQEQPAVDLAKSFERRKCNHREPISGEECLESVIGDTNKHRYVVATQSQPLRVKLRSIPATPLIHINRSVMVLEPPSDVTLKAKTAKEEILLHATAPDLALARSSGVAEVSRKRKGPKGPNPLSVKKKKTSNLGEQPTIKREASTPSSTVVGSKRKAEDAGDAGSGDEHGNDNATHSDTAKRRRKRRKRTQASNSTIHVDV